MDARTLRWTALAFACLCLAACKDKHDPLKPTVVDSSFATSFATTVASAVPA